MVRFAPVLSPIKRLVVISASAAAGAVLALAVVGGGVWWYSSQPERPKPWDTEAITATFDSLYTHGSTRPESGFTFNYMLENTTEIDYRLPESHQLDINGRLKRQGALSGGESRLSIPDSRSVLPPKERLRIAIDLEYTIPAELASEPTNEDIAAWLNEHFPNLGGFVVFDSVNRYQIEFPNGWDNLEPK